MVSMNIHHLELFYYVARFGGISEAVRNMPYGIQQPAISGQIIQLEEFLGATLFHRRPFTLTPAGEELYRYIEPFFANLGSMTLKLQGGTAHHIRVGASEVVLRDYMPSLTQEVRKKFPKLRFTLREGYQPQIEAWLDKQEIDFGLTLLGERQIPGITAVPLLKLPLALVVPRKSRVKTADDLWKLDKIDEALITLPAYEAVCRNFQHGLSLKGLDWFPSIEVSSFKLIETYVASGFGIGLFLQIPNTVLAPALRFVPLPEFEPVVFGALWRGKTTSIIEAFLQAIKTMAESMTGGQPL
jgi:DNA-binding transcriptional LysR family regulator